MREYRRARPGEKLGQQVECCKEVRLDTIQRSLECSLLVSGGREILTVVPRQKILRTVFMAVGPFAKWERAPGEHARHNGLRKGLLLGCSRIGGWLSKCDQREREHSEFLPSLLKINPWTPIEDREVESFRGH